MLRETFCGRRPFLMVRVNLPCVVFVLSVLFTE